MDNYRTRQERVDYLQANFRSFLQGKILDVGCDKAYLRERVGRANYVGVDLYGDPDARVNLEQAVLPFGSNTFDCVICLDVLEHLEHIHQLFGELARVTRAYMIVSLPNPLGQYWPQLVRGGGRSVHYGLPPDPPADRHRWFFNYEEAKAFLVTMARRHQMHVVRLTPVSLVEESIFWKAFIKRLLKWAIAPTGDRRLNLSAQAIWAVLERPT
jgi:2-polyprenyl-3-methyl-5-hydroxy-6-metoxy-1,4-benzoquinol methylase